MSTAAIKRYSVEEYLAMERAAETKSEYYDGEIFAMAGASEAHNLITGNLIAELKIALKGRPCRVYPSDMRVRTSRKAYTYPDVTVMCGESRFEGDRRDILLNPLVIFEVLSPTTELLDRVRKFQSYQGIFTLQAYVLVSQESRRVEHFLRQEGGNWLLTVAETGRLDLPALGCSLPFDEIYTQVELPTAAMDDGESA